MSRFLPAIVLIVIAASVVSAAEFTIEKTDDGLTVKMDGQLVTRYVTKSGTKPILWPIVGPTGKEMTRGWPMRDKLAFEKDDHIHHRSLWFTHGSVNGVDFWAETGKGEYGNIVHKEFVKQSGGATATIVAKNDWVGPDKVKVCEEEQTIVIGGGKDTRWIDFTTVMKASEGPVVFGETKEGSFGVRVHETMKVEAKKGGQIVNSEGLKNDAAWSKPAAWVDYYGPIDDQTLGIAILQHPSSFRYPTTWHVRTYGLFAANPFGGKDFKQEEKYGPYTLEKGKTMTLRFRVLLHKGTTEEAKIAEAFTEYAK